MLTRYRRRLSAILLINGLLISLYVLAGQPDQDDRRSHLIPFKKNQFSVGFYTDTFMDVDLPHPPSPIFWEAPTHPDYGFIIMYQRTTYHTKRHFSLNIGASASRWVRQQQDLYTASLFIMLRYWFWRHRNFSTYFLYSIGGPTWISRRHFGPAELGKHFIFQDMLGIGARFGTQHVINAELYLLHYSNGDIFFQNSGLDVPIVFSLGYSF